MDTPTQASKTKHTPATSLPRNERGLIHRPSIDHDPVKPWQWGDMPFKADPVEIVSYPIPAPGRGSIIDRDATIMVRMQVGDPTSICEVSLRLIACFAPDRHEWYYRPKYRYNDNPTAFIFADENPGAACGTLLRDLGEL